MDFDPARQPEVPRQGRLAGWISGLTGIDYGYGLLLLLSFSSTMFGLYEFAAQGGTQINGAILFFCVTVVALITFAMGFCGSVAFGASRIRMPRALRVACVGFYTLSAYLSLLFAFAFWWGALAARGATDAQTNREIARIETGLAEVSQDLGQVSAQMARLAAAARVAAQTESQSGNTCGTASDGWPGPRSLLRGRHADLFDGAAVEIGSRVTGLNADLARGTARVRRLRDAAASETGSRVENLIELRAELTRLAGSGARLAADPAIAALAVEMTRIAQAYRAPGGHTDASGARLTCVDIAIATNLDGALNSLRAIRTVTPPQFEIYEGSRATTEAMGRLTTTVLLRPIGMAPAEHGLQGWNDYIPFGFALIVDGLILLIAIYRGRQRRGADPVAEAEADIAERRRERAARRLRVDDEADFQIATLDALKAGESGFSDLLVERGGRHYLVVPMRSPDQSLAALATSHLRVLMALDALRAGVREQTRYQKMLARWRHERCARRLLQALGPQSTKWAQCGGFRWFHVTPEGLANVAAWAAAAERMEGKAPLKGPEPASGPTVRSAERAPGQAETMLFFG